MLYSSFLFTIGLLALFVQNSSAAECHTSFTPSLVHPEDPVHLAKHISTWYIQHIKKTAKEHRATCADGSLLPSFPDPDCFGSFNIPIDIPIPVPPSRIYGFFNLTKEAKVTGLSKIKDNVHCMYDEKAETLMAGYSFEMPAAALNGEYDMSISIEAGEETTPAVVGHGPMTLSLASSFSIHALFNVPSTGNLGLPEFNLDFGFKNFKIDGGETFIGEEQIDWEAVSSSIQSNFDKIWSKENKELVNWMVRCSVDHAINGCTLQDLGNPDTNCYKMEPPASCFKVPEKPDDNGTGNLLSSIFLIFPLALLNRMLQL